jgi:hypothetical protein
LPNPNSKIAALGGLGAGRKWVVMVLNDHKAGGVIRTITPPTLNLLLLPTGREII